MLISVDTLRADRLGAWGHAAHVSPFLDSLAEQGVVFEQTVAQSPWTAPSHAAMLTSTWPSVLGFAGAYMGPEAQGFVHADAISLAEVLRDAGWRTQAVTAGGFVAARFGFDQGFEAYGERDATLSAAIAQALTWLDARDGDEPFFLFLHTYDVKRYRAGSAQRELLESRHGIRLRDRHPLAALLQINDVQALPEITPAFRAFVADLYDAAITRADTELSRLWQELERRDLAAATLFVVTSDHGEEFWEHGSSGHGYSLHDENVRVPLILRHPSLEPQRIAAQVRLVDLAPTLVDLLGLAVPQAWSGVSLVPWIEGTGEDLPAFSEAAHWPLKAVRTPSHKLDPLGNPPAPGALRPRSRPRRDAGPGGSLTPPARAAGAPAARVDRGERSGSTLRIRWRRDAHPASAASARPAGLRRRSRGEPPPEYRALARDPERDRSSPLKRKPRSDRRLGTWCMLRA